MLTKDELEALYTHFNRAEVSREDPISQVRSGLCAGDFEIVSFIVAGLSYGRVEQIQKSCAELWRRLEKMGLGAGGEGITTFLRSDFDARALKSALKNWSHRLNTADDLRFLLLRLAEILRNKKSLAELWQSHFADSPAEHIHNFSSAFRSPRKAPARRAPTQWKGTGLSWFAASPQDGSTCKRLMMWLRWMIRRDEIDPGLWQRPELLNPDLARPHASRLFYPVDTHIFRWSQKNKILRRKSPNWRAVEEITAHFIKIAAEDPVRYDFAICHLQMREFRQGSPRRP